MLGCQMLKSGYKLDKNGMMDPLFEFILNHYSPNELFICYMFKFRTGDSHCRHSSYWVEDKAKFHTPGVIPHAQKRLCNIFLLRIFLPLLI